MQNAYLYNDTTRAITITARTPMTMPRIEDIESVTGKDVFINVRQAKGAVAMDDSLTDQSMYISVRFCERSTECQQSDRYQSRH